MSLFISSSKLRFGRAMALAASREPNTEPAHISMPVWATSKLGALSFAPNSASAIEEYS